MTGSAAITNGQVRGLHQAAVPDQQRTGTKTSSSDICKKVAKFAACLVASAGMSSLVSKAISDPTVLSSALSKVASALKEGGAFVGGHLGLFAGATVVAGAVNVIDGVRTVAVNAKESIKLSKTDCMTHTIPGQELARTNAFNKLKKMYASAQVRGVLQTAVGLTAVALGAITVVGLISNPYVLAAVGGTAALLFLGIQVHKFIQNRQIKAEVKKFEATIPTDNRSAAGLGANDPASVSRVRFHNPGSPTLSNRSSDHGSVSRGPWTPVIPNRNIQGTNETFARTQQWVAGLPLPNPVGENAVSDKSSSETSPREISAESPQGNEDSSQTTAYIPHPVESPESSDSEVQKADDTVPRPRVALKASSPLPGARRFIPVLPAIIEPPESGDPSQVVTSAPPPPLRHDGRTVVPNLLVGKSNPPRHIFDPAKLKDPRPSTPNGDVPNNTAAGARSPQTLTLSQFGSHNGEPIHIGSFSSGSS